MFLKFTNVAIEINNKEISLQNIYFVSITVLGLKDLLPDFREES